MAGPRRKQRLGDRLAAARRRGFVGRTAELELLRSLLAGREPRHAIVHLVGPGGIGKTALVGELVELARAAGLPVIAIDARSIAPTPADLLREVARAAGSGEPAPFDALAAHPRAVVVLDTFEALAPLDAWLADVFLPQVPAGCLVVTAGRLPPSARMAAAWGRLSRVIALRNLAPEDSRAYLRGRGVPAARHDAAFEFTHGHPLALSLVADVIVQADAGDEVVLRPEDQPDVVRVLLDHFVQRVPGPVHRAALEACAHVRALTEDLLAAALGQDDVHDLFEWLRGLSFVEHGPHGLFPHDLVRDLIDGELRWRSPDRYRAMHRRVRDPIVARLQRGRGLDQEQRAFFDLLFLHRHNPIMRPYYQWKSLGSLYVEPPGPGDREAVVAMVRRHEGASSARVAAHWLERQPGAFAIFRGGDAGPRGFAAHLRIDPSSAGDLGADPLVSAAWDHVARVAPLRPGEHILYTRFFMDRELHQVASPVFDMTAATSTMRWLTEERLAWSFIALADIEYWQPMFANIDFSRAPGAEVGAGGGRAGVVAHDWRAQPPIAWLDALGARELATGAAREPEAPAPLVVLSRPAFEQAVRRVLQDWGRPAALAASPLLRSRVVLDRASGGPAVEALRELVAAAADSLRGRPRDEKFHRAVEATYLRPAPTQELAAERLGLPFGTYRYQLGVALDRVVEWLWLRELGDA